jgi:hypothetical protein
MPKPRTVRECKTPAEMFEYVKQRDTKRLELNRIAVAKYRQKKAAQCPTQ